MTPTPTTAGTTRYLLIVDDNAERLEVSRLPLGSPAGNVDLLPLTSRWDIIDGVVRRVREETLAEIRVLDSGRLLGEERELLMVDLPRWSQDLGDRMVEGRSTKEWLSLPDGVASAFWFGAIGERNEQKAPEYLLVAQVRVVDRLLRAGSYTACIIAVRNPLARSVLVDVARALGIEALPVVPPRRASRAWFLRDWIQGSGRLAPALKALALWARYCAWGLLARGLTLKPAIWSASSPFLFLTYFPYVDREAASRGEFKNRYAGPLQDLLRNQGRPVWWLCHFVFMDGFGFRGAARLARRLVGAGERLAMVEAYFTPFAALRTLRGWLQLRRRARKLERILGPALGQGLLPPSALGLASQLWIRSYEGPDLMHGLYHYAVFSAVMRYTQGIPACLYYCEFHNWEHALNAAAHARRPPLETFAFQHATVSSHDLCYARPPAEVQGRGDSTDLALPDRLCVSGDGPAGILSPSGYRGMTVVESVRYLPLSAHLAKEPPRVLSRPPVLLIAGTGYPREASALLSLVAKAYPRSDGIRIWLRGHPSAPMERAAQEIGLDVSAAGYESATGDLYQALSQVDLLLVTSSTLAIEALAFGCEVLVAGFPSFLCHSPLDGFERLCKRVYTAEDIQECVRSYQKHGPSVSRAEKQSFVRHYWDLDAGLPRWHALLDAATAKPAAVGSDG